MPTGVSHTAHVCLAKTHNCPRCRVSFGSASALERHSKKHPDFALHAQQAAAHRATSVAQAASGALAYLRKCGHRDVTITDADEEAALFARGDPVLDEFGGTKVGTSLPSTVRAFWEQTGYTRFPPVTEPDLDDEAFAEKLRTSIRDLKHKYHRLGCS